ncbi:MAG: N-acetylgalactosamine-6-sulfatase, partial [Bacteroidota bacterium]
YDGFRGSPGMKAVAPHGMLLFNLKNDPSESINLAYREPEQLQRMLQEMESARARLGAFPTPLVIRTPPDNSHYHYLKNKRKRR